jgi:hypothetical protein
MAPAATPAAFRRRACATQADSLRECDAIIGFHRSAACQGQRCVRPDGDLVPLHQPSRQRPAHRPDTADHQADHEADHEADHQADHEADHRADNRADTAVNTSGDPEGKALPRRDLGCQHRRPTIARSDGQTLPTNQVATWGKVDSTGTHVIIWVKANPRYGYVSGFGSYSGTASLNDSHALGGNVPVDIHVLYPNISLVLVAGFLAAFGGFTWAWLVHDLRQEPKNPGNPGEQKADENTFFWRNLILRIAVLLAATIPVVNVQVLANPDWSGDLTQYIALATLAGAAAIALTPTFRVLALRPGLSRDTNEGDS